MLTSHEHNNHDDHNLYFAFNVFCFYIFFSRLISMPVHLSKCLLTSRTNIFYRLSKTCQSKEQSRQNPIQPTNPSVQMAYKGQSSFRITAILYSYRALKTLFRPIKSTNPSVWMAYKLIKARSVLESLLLLIH